MMKAKHVLAVAAVFGLCLTTMAGNMVRFGRASVIIYPTGDNAPTGFTKNTTNYYEAIDEPTDASGLPAGDGDTTYIDAPKSTTSNIYFDLSNSGVYGAANTKIRFVTVAAQGRRNNDSGSGVASTVITIKARVGGTNYTWGSVTFTSTTDATFTNVSKLYLNPATSLAWTASDIDALQLYIERTTGTRYDARLTAMAVVVAYDEDFTTLPTTRIRVAGS